MCPKKSVLSILRLDKDDTIECIDYLIIYDFINVQIFYTVSFYMKSVEYFLFPIKKANFVKASGLI